MDHEVKPAETDPYWKLRPAPASPENELCHCTDAPAITLRTVLSPNPIGCLRCNREVLPERIGFSADVAENIASWRSVAESLWLLWLDSGEYEQWAKDKLENPNSQVQRAGT
jgi:hypothetical protein